MRTTYYFGIIALFTQAVLGSSGNTENARSKGKLPQRDTNTSGKTIAKRVEETLFHWRKHDTNSAPSQGIKLTSLKSRMNQEKPTPFTASTTEFTWKNYASYLKNSKDERMQFAKDAIWDPPEMASFERLTQMNARFYQNVVPNILDGKTRELCELKSDDFQTFMDTVKKENEKYVDKLNEICGQIQEELERVDRKASSLFPYPSIPIPYPRIEDEKKTYQYECKKLSDFIEIGKCAQNFEDKGKPDNVAYFTVLAVKREERKEQFLIAFPHCGSNTYNVVTSIYPKKKPKNILQKKFLH